MVERRLSYYSIIHVNFNLIDSVLVQNYENLFLSS